MQARIHHKYVRLLWPMTFITTFTIIREVLKYYNLDYKLAPDISVVGALGAVRLMIFAWLINGLIDVVIFENTLQNKRDAKFAKFLKISVTFLVYGGFLLVILGSELKTPLVAVTGFLGAVIIFGLRDLVERISYGTVLNIGAEFNSGDVVRVYGEYFNKIVKINEINLNYTYLEDEIGNLIIVPNSVFKSLIVCNYSTSTQHISFNIELDVNPQHISIDEVESLFESALLSLPLILCNPKPKVLINMITASGDIQYQLVFYTNINQLIVYEVVKSQIYRKILEYANISGINPQAFKINTEQLNLNVQNSRLALGNNISQTLKITSLFADLVPTDIEKLAKNTKIHVFHQNESIINQAENGSSMYILVHGMLNGTIMDLNNDKEIASFTIVPGQFFGEMSLFLGEPRSAFVTVQTKNALVYEIAKESLFELFESNPALLEKIATKVAERRRSNTQTQRNYLSHLSHSGLADSTQYTLKLIKQWLGFK